MQAARILVDGQSDLVLDYGIPPEAGDVKPGCRVQVPLRNRTATGTVLTLSEPAPAWKDRLKPILKLIDPEPLISPVMMNLASWAADYYSVALDQMIRCLLPETVRQENTAEKMRKMVYLEKTPAREELDALYRKAPRQAQMLDYFSSAKQQSAPLAAFGAGALNVARSLEAKGFISLKEEAVHRDPSTGEQFVPTQPMKLNSQQQKALEEITAMCAAERKKTGPAARSYRFRQDGGLLTGRFPNSKIRKIRPDHGAGNFPDAPDGSAFQIPFRRTAFLRGSAAQPPLGRGAL